MIIGKKVLLQEEKKFGLSLRENIDRRSQSLYEVGRPFIVMSATL